MAVIGFHEVGKVYPGGTRAIEDVNLEVGDGDRGLPALCGEPHLPCLANRTLLRDMLIRRQLQGPH